MADLNSADPAQADYLIRFAHADGRRDTELIRASSGREAIDQLAARGCTDIELLTDDFDRVLQATPPRRLPLLTPRDLARIQSPSLLKRWLYNIWLMYVSLWPAYALVGATFLFRRSEGRAFNWIDGILIPLFLLPLFLKFAFFNRRSSLFRSIQTAYVHADWGRVLVLVDQYESEFQHKDTGTTGLIMVAEWRGKALVRLGRVGEGLAAVERLKDFNGMRPASYWYVRSSVYLAARNYEAAIECYREICQADPKSSAGLIGMAEVFAVWLNRPMEARAALNRVEQFPTSVRSAWGRDYLEGVVLLAESRFVEARQRFEKCLPHVLRLTRSTPVSHGIIAVLKAQLAIACARCDNTAAGLSHYNTVKDFLELHSLEPLHARCRAQLGLPLQTQTVESGK